MKAVRGFFLRRPGRTTAESREDLLARQHTARESQQDASNDLRPKDGQVHQVPGAVRALDHVARTGPRADGSDTGMEAANPFTLPLQEAQRQIKNIVRMTTEAHAYLDMAGVPACLPDSQGETRSLWARVRRLQSLEYRHCALLAT
jgi:hypothetical protein